MNTFDPFFSTSNSAIDKLQDLQKHVMLTVQPPEHRKYIQENIPVEALDDIVSHEMRIATNGLSYVALPGQQNLPAVNNLEFIGAVRQVSYLEPKSINMRTLAVEFVFPLVIGDMAVKQKAELQRFALLVPVFAITACDDRGIPQFALQKSQE